MSKRQNSLFDFKSKQSIILDTFYKIRHIKFQETLHNLCTKSGVNKAVKIHVKSNKI
jgi:hypothetical protein